MTRASRVRFVSTVLVCFGTVLLAQERIENWPAPGLWSPAAKVVAKGDLAPLEAEAVEAVPTPPLHFVGITPCRLVDTRGNGFTGQYGPPSLPQGAPRNFVLAGQCGISGAAQAVSLNVTVTNTQGPGFILIYPQGSAQPTVSTLNYVAGQTVANAAVVPLGAGGGVTVIAGVSATDLIIDTNGDYEAGVVTTLNGLSGNVNLAAGSNVTITPAGQTLTVAATGGPGGVLPTGTSGQTLRHNGSAWVANGNLQNDGSTVEVQGILKLPDPQTLVNAGASRFLYSDTSNLFLGTNAGGPSSGQRNTAIGNLASLFNTTGADNTAVGYRAHNENQSGNSNTAVGSAALDDNDSGSSNIAVGYRALSNISTGSSNIGIGINVGTNISTGSNNIYIGNDGSGNESGQIRIGTVGNITGGTVIVGIHSFGSSGGIPVIVNAGGRLGTTTSSLRYKENVRDIGPESEGLMSLRPVAFKYKPDHEPGGLAQYGLIAEEVAEIYPELVVYDDEGRPQAIRSQLLDPLLLNEIQKQRRSIEAQRTEIDDLKAELAKLVARLDGSSEP